MCLGRNETAPGICSGHNERDLIHRTILLGTRVLHYMVTVCLAETLPFLKAVTCDTLQHTPGIWKNRGMDLLDSSDLLLHLQHGREFRVRRDDVMKPPARAPPHGEGILELFQNDPFPDHSMESVMEYDLCADA